MNNKPNVHKVEEVQKVLLEMLSWFHEFCKKNDIRYYIIGGTMLGAARHSGFIPWDDDIDVAIPRRDYERLLQRKEEYLSNERRYTFESYKDGNRDFEYEFAKLYDSSTTLIENCRMCTHRGLYIDVFPLDGIGDSREEAIRNFKPIKWRLNMLAVRACAIRRGRSFAKNMVVAFSYLLPHRFFNNHKSIAKIEKLCMAHDFDSSEYVGNLVGNGREREIMPRAYFGNPTLYRFENLEVYGVEDYDNYLKCIYHDWRQLPPKEKRKSEHDYILVDLHKSYKR